MFTERPSEVGEIIPNNGSRKVENQISKNGPDDGMREIKMEGLLLGEDTSNEGKDTQVKKK